MSDTTTRYPADRSTHPGDVVPPGSYPAAPPALPRRLVRVAGALGLTHVVLLLAGIGLQDTVLFSEGREGMTTYAEGSLRAARFVLGRRPGLYGMDQVLGLAPAAA